MKKENDLTLTDEEMLPEYDFRGGVRGKYAHKFVSPPVTVELAPDVATAFPDSAAVNEALRTLFRIVRTAPPKLPV